MNIVSIELDVVLFVSIVLKGLSQFVMLHFCHIVVLKGSWLGNSEMHVCVAICVFGGQVPGRVVLGLIRN